MKIHSECKNYISLDCDKGQCALSKLQVRYEDAACPNFVQAPFCGNCAHFGQPNEVGIATCKGMAKESWAFATCSAETCDQYVAK